MTTKRNETAKKYYVCEYKPFMPPGTAPKAYRSIEKAKDDAAKFFSRNLQSAAKPVRPGDIDCHEVPEEEFIEYESFFEKR